MTFLETLARKAFYKFCNQLQEDGVWENLSPKRRLAWNKEVKSYLDLVIEELSKPLKKAPTPDSKVNTSYAMGFNQGVNSERVKFITVLDNLKKQIDEEINELESTAGEE